MAVNCTFPKIKLNEVIKQETSDDFECDPDPGGTSTIFSQPQTSVYSPESNVTQQHYLPNFLLDYSPVVYDRTVLPHISTHNKTQLTESNKQENDNFSKTCVVETDTKSKEAASIITLEDGLEIFVYNNDTKLEHKEVTAFKNGSGSRISQESEDISAHKNLLNDNDIFRSLQPSGTDLRKEKVKQIEERQDNDQTESTHSAITSILVKKEIVIPPFGYVEEERAETSLNTHIQNVQVKCETFSVQAALKKHGISHSVTISCEPLPDLTFGTSYSVKEIAETSNASQQRAGFKCEQCVRIFSTESSLKKHVELCCGEHHFDTCIQSSVNPAELGIHEQAGEGRELWKCDECGGQFTTKHSLVVHSRIHRGDRPHKCDVCQASFTQAGDLTVHKRKHSGDKPYACEQCPKRFTSSGNLTKHRRVIHQGVKPHACHECHARFPTAWHLAQHARSHTGEKPVQCHLCQKRFADTCKLRMHLRTHTGERRYKCDVCGTAFARLDMLKNHAAVHTGERAYKCDTCSATFTTAASLFQHKKRHGAKAFACLQCGAAFPVANELRVHVRTHTGEKPYPCPECPARFSSAGNLKKHLASHAGVTPFECQQCKKKFTSKSSLDKHCLRHQGIKPHVCGDCGKAFTEKGDLRKHLRVHTGERPYGCSQCQARFASAQNLRSHTAKCHPKPKAAELQISIA